jgi:hypothetical protein
MKVPVTWVAAATLLGACYTHTNAGPVNTASPKLGTRVTLQLTPQGVATFSGQLGPQVTYVEGDILESDTAALRLTVRRVEDSRHISTGWKGEQVTVPREAIATITERRLSVGATAIMGALAVGGVLGAYAAFGTTGGTDGVAIPPPGPRQ